MQVTVNRKLINWKSGVIILLMIANSKYGKDK